MYISTPSGVCDTCHIAQEGSLEELTEEYHWELDEFDQLSCGGCTLAREYALDQAAPAEELATMGAIVAEDPAVQALGDEAGTFNTNEAAVLAEVAKVNKKRAAKRRKLSKRSKS